MEIIPIIIFIFISIFLNEKKREKAALNGKVKKAPKNFFENIINYYKEEMERQQKLIDFKKDKTPKTFEIPIFGGPTSEDLNIPHRQADSRSKSTSRPITHRKNITRPSTEISLKKPNIDIKTILLTPFILITLSLFITKIKIGGTVMSTLHGWPYPLLNHQIKDVVDNIPINEWIVNLGSFYHYVVFDYLFYLVITIVLYSFIKLANRD